MPLRLPVFVSNAAHEGLPVMAKVSMLALASEALGWKLYARPATAWVPGVPEMAGGAGGVLTPTEMVKAGSDTLWYPSLALMTMPESEPTSVGPGVPVSRPVFALNVAQDGLFVIEKVSGLPEALVVLGWKEYTMPTMAWAAGVPEIVGALAPALTAAAAAPGAAAGEPELVPTTSQPASVAAERTQRIR